MTRLDRDTLAGPTRGPVDLVAIDRVLHGVPTALTDDELDYLTATLTGDQEEVRCVAAALGVGPTAIEQRLHRWRTEQRKRGT